MYTITSSVIERNRCLGFVNKNEEFVQLTNWAPTVVGVVKEEGAMLGVIISHPPDAVVGDAINNFQSYLSMKDISSQKQIKDKLKHSEALFIAPSKDEYLPSYLLKMANEYNAGNDAVILKPLQSYGLQTSSDNAFIWALPSTDGCIFVRLDPENNVSIVPSSDVGIADVLSVCSRHALSLPATISFNIQPLKDMIGFLKRSYINDFPSSVAIIASMSICFHYPFLKTSTIGIPIPVVMGKPGTYKSSVSAIAAATIGILSKAQDSTYDGILKMICNEQFPIWLEDLDDFRVWEKLTMIIYNQAEKITFKSHADKEPKVPKSMPLITSNGFFRNVGNEISLQRVLGRIVIIPFVGNLSVQESTLQENWEFETNFMDVKANSKHCIGFVISLLNELKNYKNNEPSLAILNEIFKNHKDMDERTRKNYGLLLFTMEKILERCDMSMDETKKVLVEFMQRTTSYARAMQEESSNEGKRMLEDLLKNCLREPWGKNWVIYSDGRHHGCNCGWNIEFNLGVLIGKFPNKTYDKACIKKYISQNGCVKRNMKYKPIGYQRTSCFHLRVSALPVEILEQVGLNHEIETEREIPPDDMESTAGDMESVAGDTENVLGDLETESNDFDSEGNENAATVPQRDVTRRALNSLIDNLSQNEKVSGRRKTKKPKYK